MTVQEMAAMAKWMEGRTKAEAIENPIAGDRWEKCEKLLRTRLVQGISFDNWIYYRDQYGSRRACSMSSFRRWAAGAEFLGGAQ